MLGPMGTGLVIAAILMMAAGPGDAAADSDAQIAARLLTAQARTGVASVQSRCDRPRQGDEIVVCVDRGEDLRVPTTAESDPSSLAARRARNNGVPLAPQLDRGSCKGQPGCIVGGWAPPPLYLIDLKAIPEAPEGSDADKVAKGELSDR
jgi:hypothetical protein